MFEYFTKVLDNGFRLAFIPTGAPTISVQLWVGAGSKYETKKIRGLAHFLEHMAFKGTKRRPTPLAIAQEMDRIGARYNASTTKERIVYWLKTVPEHLELAFDFLTDIVFRPLLNPEEIEKERGVIIEEINMYQDLPMAKVEEIFLKTVLGNNPLGWEIAGTRKTVRQLKRTDFLTFQEQFFSPQNMVFIVAGGLKKKDWPRIVSLAKEYLAPKKSWPVIKKKVEFQPKSKRFVWHNQATQQVHLILGRPTFPLADQRRYQWLLLCNILAGNTSSRLWQEIREKRGWAYYLHFDNYYYQETGLFLLKAGVAQEHWQEAVAIIKREIKQLGQSLTQEELDRAKSFWLGRNAIRLENPGFLARLTASSWLLLDRIETVAEAAAQIKKTTLHQLRQLAQEFFQSDSFYLAAVGQKTS